MVGSSSTMRIVPRLCVTRSFCRGAAGGGKRAARSSPPFTSSPDGVEQQLPREGLGGQRGEDEPRRVRRERFGGGDGRERREEQPDALRLGLGEAAGGGDDDDGGQRERGRALVGR